MEPEIHLVEIPTNPKTKYYKLYHRVERLRAWVRWLGRLQLLLFLPTIAWGGLFLGIMFINGFALLILMGWFIETDRRKAKQLTHFVIDLEPDTSP